MNSSYTIPHLPEPTLRTFKNPPPQGRRTTVLPGGIAAFLLTCILALLGVLPAGAQSYTARLVQSPDASFQPQSLNDNGEVTGHYFPDGGLAKPVLWRDGTLVELPLLPGTAGGIARGSNNLGQIVGACFDSGGGYQACIWENGSVTALPTLSGTFQAEAIDINDAGGVVGYATVVVAVYPDGSVAQRQDALVWQGGTVAALTPPYPDMETSAQAIDASGRVAVSVYDEWSGWVPGRWTPDVPNGTTGTFEILDPWGYAYDINDSGVVCGFNETLEAVLWNGSTRAVLGVLPGHSQAYAKGINNAGDVVGTSLFAWDDGFQTYYEYTAFVWDAERGMRDLNAFLNPDSAVSGGLSDALAINRAGQILATSGSGYVLLTPSILPPPLPAPKGLFSQAGNQSVELSWDPVTVADGYNVKRSTVSGGPYTTIATGVTSTTYADQSAVNGVRYYYVVSALADTRESANSNETTAKPLAPPIAPTGLLAKVAKAKVTLTWRQSTSPEILRNRIYRSTNGGAYVLIADIPAALTWTDTQAQSKTNYRYVVTAVNAIWLESPASNAVSASPK